MPEDEMMPAISIIIPAYKAARTIGRAIDSVLAQTLPAHEILVVDDGSPDDLAEVVERDFGDRVTLIRKSNGGAASARNAGIDRATGDFIAFLDADDYWEPNKLAIQMDVFARHPEVAVVAGRYFDEVPGQPRFETGPAATFCDEVRAERGPTAFRLATCMWTGTVIVRREAIATERFVSGLEPAEDRDVWARLAARHPICLLSMPLATAVHVPDSLSRSNLDRDCSNMLRVIERHRDLLGPRACRAWEAFVLYRWSAVDDNPRSALPRLVRSFLHWPFSLRGTEASIRFGRLKRLLTLVRLLCIPRRRAEPASDRVAHRSPGADVVRSS